MENKKSVACPVCGAKDMLDGVGTHDTCTVCGWIDENWMRKHPDDTSGNGKWTLNTAKEAWEKGETLFNRHPNPKGQA